METKKQKIVSAVATMGIVLMLFGATYAYFASRGDAGKITDVEITANTVDVFTFETGDPITLSLDQENMASGNGNQEGSTFARATLTANNKTNSATEHYYMYLNITSNTFKYTSESKTPEIILQVTDSNGVELSSLDGLNYVTITDGNNNSISGFDITERTNKITLLDYREISTASTKTEQWNIKIIYVNHDFDQTDNAGNSFRASLLIQKEGIFTLAEYVAKQYTGMQGENSVYYHNGTILDDDGNIMDAEDNSYRYAGGDYGVTNLATSAGLTSVFETSADAGDGVINFYCNETRSVQYTYSCSASTSYFTLSYDETTTYPNVKAVYDKAVEDGYLKTDLVKNFVCFGSDEEECPYDNLYRIVGVFDGKVKLMKYDYTTGNALGINSDYVSDNETSEYLFYRGNYESVDYYKYYYDDFWNGLYNYYSKFVAKYQSMITSSNLYAKDLSTTSFSTSKELYQASVGIDEDCNSTVSSLLIAGDYGYAFNSKIWSDASSAFSSPSNNDISDNWLLMGCYELLLNRYVEYFNDDFYGVFLVLAGYDFLLYQPGYVSRGTTPIYNTASIRPAFYLSETVMYQKGEGTYSSPIRLS